MKFSSLSTMFGLLVATASCSSVDTSAPIDLVDPFIGTGFHGHTYPGATVPFGAVQLGPDTRMGNWDACSGYHYSDSTIDGFSMTHLSGTGCIDLADILFRPVPGNAPMPFSHKNEKASPGYYEVTLTDPSIKVELTASEHCGLQRYTYPDNQQATVTIDLFHSLEPGESRDSIQLAIVGNDCVQGMRITSGWTPNQHIYFTTRFSAPFEKAEFDSAHTTVTLTFAPDLHCVMSRTGISSVSVANAAENLQAEISDFDFDATHAAARALWSQELDKIIVEGGSLSERRTFYTALYHTMVVPNIVSDINGQYRRNNQEIATLDGNAKRYSTFSIWDTYRAWNPLMTIINPGLVGDMVNSMMDMYDAQGELPIWPLASGETKCMIGYHSASVIADAHLKGIGGFDSKKALDAMVTSSNINEKGSEQYTSMGFIPANEKREAVSVQLEFAYDDWCIARMAESIGDTATARQYYNRAQSYANVFDGSTRFFRGKRGDGNWVGSFNPQAVDRSFTEATPWQYRFYAPHDVNGLINLFGGREAFASALDSIFLVSSEIVGELSDITGMKGQYAHGNEPSHHIAYLYNYVGQPWKTQALTRQLLSEMYQDTPEGIIGNEDCGQMSAWYVMTALGLYPFAPGNGEYSITTPLFPRATIKLGNGKTLIITANNPDKNHYIKSLSFNGKPVDVNYLTHEQLMEGGELKFELASSPVTTRGTADASLPYSLTKNQKVSVPYIAEDLYLFLNNSTVTMGTATEGAEIHYTVDGSEPTVESPLYTKPFTIDASTSFKVKAFKDGMEPSNTVSLRAEKAELHPSTAITGLKNGVSYTYVEGVFNRVAQLASSTVKEQGVMPEPSIAGAHQPDHFGYTFTGYINVPVDGVYTFMTRSDDGSVLKIGDEVVVNNDGSHAAIPATGLIPLAKGLHPFTLLYFEDYEGEELSWGWALPGSDEIVPIPANVLFTK